MDKNPDYHPTLDQLTIGGDRFTVLASSQQTNDALFAIELEMSPGGGPPVMHRHDPGEVYHILDGEFTFYTGGFGDPVRRITAVAGETVPLAGGIPHTVRNESQAPASAFVVHAPGPPMEHFTRAAAALAAGGDPSMEAVLAIAAQHGVEILGPIPSLA